MSECEWGDDACYTHEPSEAMQFHPRRSTHRGQRGSAASPSNAEVRSNIAIQSPKRRALFCEASLKCARWGKDVVLIRPGASVPADGTVRDGTSEVNEAMITGESLPVKKTVNARVIAGTVNGAGSLRVEVTGTGERTALAGIMRLVADAQSTRSHAQALADRAAFAGSRRAAYFWGTPT